MKYIKRIISIIWEATVLYYYEGLIVILHRIKTGEDKFYSEIQEEKSKKKL